MISLLKSIIFPDLLHSHKSAYTDPYTSAYMRDRIIFRIAADQIDQNEHQGFPRASFGRTPVFFSPSLPVVIKQSEGLCFRRLNKMDQARQICDRNGYDHLVIPQATIHKGFLIEERLPTSESSIIRSMGFYLENKEKMTQAIREFTGFLCQSAMSDICSYRHPFIQDVETIIGRFDNIIPYLDPDGKGKIGLVDLEHFEPADKLSFSWVQLISIFPFHTEEILEEAKKFYPVLDCQDVARKLRDAALDAYRLSYTGHLEFCEKNRIGQGNGNTLAFMSEESKKNLQKSFTEEAKRWYLYDAKTDYYNERPIPLSSGQVKKVESAVQESFPRILDLIREDLSQTVDRCRDKKREDLVDCRSWIDIYGLTRLKNAVAPHMAALHSNQSAQGKCLEALFLHLMREMQQSGVIYQYKQFPHGHIAVRV